MGKDADIDPNDVLPLIYAGADYPEEKPKALPESQQGLRNREDVRFNAIRAELDKLTTWWNQFWFTHTILHPNIVEKCFACTWNEGEDQQELKKLIESQKVVLDDGAPQP